MENKSNWYIGILLWSMTVTATSIYVSSSVDDSITAFSIHAVAGITTYFISLISLSFSAAEHWRLQERSRIYRGKVRNFQIRPLNTVVLVTRVTGLIASVHVLALPIVSPTEDVVANAFLRASTFFYACMLLDLSVIRAHKPLILRHGQGKALYGLTDWQSHLEYIWRAFTETRYQSFNIAVDESRRQSIPTHRVWTYAPLLLLPVTYLLPIAELQILSGLLGLSLLLEGQHTLLHPRCPNWLFWQPFAANTITEFWSLRWHKGANSFLHSLGYAPTKTLFGKYFGENIGRAAGVLSAFSLSGIWHAWSGVPLSEDEHVWGVCGGLWIVFMLQGVGVLIESWLLRDGTWKQGRRQKVVKLLSWMYSVETASLWLRYSLSRKKKV